MIAGRLIKRLATFQNDPDRFRKFSKAGLIFAVKGRRGGFVQQLHHGHHGPIGAADGHTKQGLCGAIAQAIKGQLKPRRLLHIGHVHHFTRGSRSARNAHIQRNPNFIGLRHLIAIGPGPQFRAIGIQQKNGGTFRLQNQPNFEGQGIENLLQDAFERRIIDQIKGAQKLLKLRCDEVQEANKFRNRKILNPLGEQAHPIGSR